MVDEVDETVRAAFADMYQKGYVDGYGAGLAAALEKIQALATENGVPMPSKGPSLEEHISSLELTVRAYNSLFREGIRKIGDIYDFHNKEGLGSIRNFGKTSFDQLNMKLMNAGYPTLGRYQ